MSRPQSNPSEDQRGHALGNESAGVIPAYARPNGELEWPSPGLTKRELFAAMIAQGLAPAYAHGGDFMEQHVAEGAVLVADALLKELAK